jgi:23S rRNA (uracil1939-C5)-methyltransferase
MSDIKNHRRGAQAPLLGSKIKVSVEKLAIGGAGVARHEGMVVFIPGAAPQEELLVKITLAKKNFAEAEIVEVLTPSPFRREPPCPVANVCGGCNWQHLTEEAQQKQKELLVQETLKKFNPQLQFDYLPLQPSPRSFRYRNRIQPKAQNGKFGFFGRNSHQVIDIKDCPITEESLTEKFSEVRAWLAEKNPGPRLQKMEMYLDTEQNVRYGLISDEDDGVGFSQVNRFQNPALIETVLNWVQQESYGNIHDLYSGAGNFTFPLGQQFPKNKVTGIELNPKLVLKGTSENKNSHIHFIESDVEKYVLKTKINSDDLVILDPPRMGCSKATIKALAKARPRKIIYISCHPVSLARDLKWFFETATQEQIPWVLTRVQAFEMFPQTDHVETIAELRVDS